MKPPQRDPRIHYLLSINRVPKDSALGASIKLNPSRNHLKSNLLLRKAWKAKKRFKSG